MKHFALYLFIALLLTACDKNVTIVPSTDSEELIIQIVHAPVVDAVSVTDLNPAIAGYIHDAYMPLTIDMAYCAQHLGYEVVLENGLFCYFSLDGHHLDHDGMHGDDDNFHGGCRPGINHCMAGDTLNIGDIPDSILAYLADNYPGVLVTTVILKPSGHLSVELDNGEVLMFDGGGDVMNVCLGLGTGGHAHMHPYMDDMGWQCDPDDQGGMGGGGMGNHHGGMGSHGTMGNQQGNTGSCWGGDSIVFDQLPSMILDYVDNMYPDETILFAMQTYGGNFMLRLSNCIHLVFDENGNVIFDSGQ